MSEKKQVPGSSSASAPSSDRCCAEGCKETQKKLTYCNEHFVWFKEGLINKKGERPNDFDKKYQHFMRKKAA